MLRFSYTISPVLKDALRTVDSLRDRILLAPLNPKSLLQLQWEAKLDRIYWSLALSNNPLGKFEIMKLLNAPKKRLNEAESQVVNYKKALDYISHNWLLTDEAVTSKTVIHLHSIISGGKTPSKETELGQLLEYLELKPEHPVIQAAIAQLDIQASAPFIEGNGRVARLFAYLLLCKYGYDFRGLLAAEEHWRRDLPTYQEITKEAIETKNITLWLTYFAKAVITRLEKALENLTYPHSSLEFPPQFWQLNERQREVLSFLDDPKTTITNQRVQKLFKVSQITASRDLAKLTTLGLLFAHGKGRSVRYSRV